ncbi:Rft-1-domain-containing protein [Lactarius akahatsu]|uniref:Man(5)GlcNAc(2)-PP-dolichol translocation protein RFT1 n=1 Tax=Lactarius akahatsu TaxID=416441 RepID=A0AAD4LA97_9AGAM|nr:Rft-1-domain-containing protein [Lactarius akahatsu]
MLPLPPHPHLLFSRIFTFVLNQALVRLATPQTFGTATVQFELLLSTTLFLSREGVRTALLRQRKSVPSDLARNIALLPAYVGKLIAVTLAVLYSATSASAVRAQQHFHLSVSIYAFAAALELAAEPLYIRAQDELRVDVRVRSEGAAVFSKTLATFLGLAFAPPAWALVAFAAGQTAYALATFAVFWNFFVPTSNNVAGPDPFCSKKDAYFDRELLHLSGAMTAQSVVKHFLTEGDKPLISRLTRRRVAYIYLIPNRLSRRARCVPTHRRDFTHLLLQIFVLLPVIVVQGERPRGAADSNCCRPTSSSHSFSFSSSSSAGPPYLPLATALVLPQRYQQTSAPRILRAFRFYLPAMAYNGVLEAFVAYVCTPADLRSQSRMMAAASAVLIATALAGARVFGAGDAALVWANTASMAVRALYAWRFARRFCKARAVAHRQRETERALRLAALRPPLGVLVTFAAAAVCTRWSAAAHADVRLSLWVQRWHVALGGACLLVCLVVCVDQSTPFLAAYVVCFYDWVISLDQEVALIYPAPWNGVKAAYLFCRYYPMAIAPFHIWGLVGNHEQSTCESYYHVLYACAMPTVRSLVLAI